MKNKRFPPLIILPPLIFLGLAFLIDSKTFFVVSGLLNTINNIEVLIIFIAKYKLLYLVFF